jgi:hypothetical protein
MIQAQIRQEPCDAAMSGDMHHLHALRIGRDDLAIGVGEAPAAVSAFTGEVACRGALWHGPAGELAHGSAGLRGAAELSDLFTVSIPNGRTGENQHVLAWHA